MTDDKSHRKSLRSELRARRRALNPGERLLAARRVAANVDHIFRLKAGQRIALYAAMPEELDAAPLIELAVARGCEIYLPRIDRHTGCIHFTVRDGATRPNHLGIDEPAGRRTIGARWLDLVFLPLVGFDAHGLRLGMGGGYYDRTFAFLNLRKTWRAPRLIGIAYQLQRIEHIEAQPHDVRLDAVVTEVGLAYKHIS
jgi:5-formyltetrahydrofolate cyclo-ligase